MLIYIDNLFIINKSSDFKALLNFKKKLNKQFKMTDLDLAKCYLSIEITHLSDRLLLIQTVFIDEILEQFDMKDFAFKFTFMTFDLQLNSDLAGNFLNDINTEYYQQMIESLLYLVLDMQSDIVCNRTMSVSSLKILMKLSACIWSWSRMNMWISEELFRTAWSYTEAMLIILMRLIRMIRLACCSITISYFWMLLFSLLIRLACSL